MPGLYNNLFGHLKTPEEKYEALVHWIAKDYVELSHDKVLTQRNEYIFMARQMLEEAAIYYPDPDYGDEF